MRVFNAIATSMHMGSPPLSLRCPACLQNGTFEMIPSQDVWLPESGVITGQRRCPNPECRAHVFVAFEPGENEPTVSYPPEVITFDASKVPGRVTAALSEAITCHANECYIASAIMVRKTLEELCADRGAKGKTLQDRIKTLETTVVLPQDLLEGVDELRLLGNDAAHLESREYDKIGREEVEIGIELAKEIIKGVYQMSGIVERLRALKRDQTT